MLEMPLETPSSRDFNNITNQKEDIATNYGFGNHNKYFLKNYISGNRVLAIPDKRNQVDYITVIERFKNKNLSEKNYFPSKYRDKY